MSFSSFNIIIISDDHVKKMTMRPSFVRDHAKTATTIAAARAVEAAAAATVKETGIAHAHIEMIGE